MEMNTRKTPAKYGLHPLSLDVLERNLGNVPLP